MDELEVKITKLEGRMDALEDRVDLIDSYVKEEFKPFHKSTQDYRVQRETLEGEREKVQKERHRSNAIKLNFIAVFTGLGLLIIAIATLLLALKH